MTKTRKIGVTGRGTNCNDWKVYDIETGEDLLARAVDIHVEAGCAPIVQVQLLVDRLDVDIEEPDEDS